MREEAAYLIEIIQDWVEEHQNFFQHAPLERRITRVERPKQRGALLVTFATGRTVLVSMSALHEQERRGEYDDR